jgi:hypothetical protein
MSEKDENADLRKRVAELEAKLAPPKTREQREAEDRKWMSEMHAMREARMNHASPPLSAEQRKAMNDACGPGDIRDIVQHGTIPGPIGQAPATSQVSGVHGPSGIPGSGTGWINSRPLSNPPGTEQADRLMDEQDRRDKAELAQRLARSK